MSSTFMKGITFNVRQFSKEKEYWLNTLSGEPEKSFFPYDFSKVQKDDPGERSTRGGRIEFTIEGELFERLIWISNKSDLRLFIIIVTVLQVLLSRYTGNEDIIVGSPIEKQDVDGDFLNTVLALRTQLRQNITFKELLMQVRETVAEAGTHQNYPLETIPLELGMENRKSGDFPLFDMAVLLENIHDKRYIDHLHINMMLSFLRTGDFIKGELEYNRSLYEEETVRRITDHFTHLIKEVFKNPEIPIGDIEFLPVEERRRLLVELNDTGAEYPQDTTVLRMFEIQAEKTPANTAVEEADTGRCMSYREVNEQAARLANLLIEKGVEPGTAVAVMGERTLEIVISILSILKVGGVFLPVDAQNPEERIRFILEDSGADIILSQKSTIERRPEVFREFSSSAVLAMDEKNIFLGKADDPVIDTGPGDPAYIIYTSGSTGQPKGVVVEHGSLLNYICFAAGNYVKGEAVNFPFYTSIAFDLTITSIFTPLITGNAVVVYSGWNKGNLIERIVDDNKVGVVKLTPSHLHLIREKKVADGAAVKRFIVGGEALMTQIANDIHDNFNGHIEIYNEYGPTEAAVGCMLYRFDPRDKGLSVPIGTPAANACIYLLDKNLKPVPAGAVGEIYIAGEGVARGYLNRPELTHEKFILVTGAGDRCRWGNKQKFCSNFFKRGSATPTHEGTGNPVVDRVDEKACSFCKLSQGINKSLAPGRAAGGKKIYKTGDLARYRSDWNMEFLGRIDQQVKIRGFRIELEEIESLVSAHEDIKEAVVIVKIHIRGKGELPGDENAAGDNDRFLCAYYVPAGESEPALKEYLSDLLPDYMIPLHFVRLEHIPLTINGKVDRKALPEPEIKTEAPYRPPGNETEERLLNIWSELLNTGRDKIGMDASFFELGGHSLSATILITKIHKEFNVRLQLVDMFQYTTIGELAELISDAGQELFIPVVSLEKKEYYALSSAQKRFFILHRLNPASTAYNIPVFMALRGKLDKDRFAESFARLVKRHESLRTTLIVIDDDPYQRITAVPDLAVDLEYHEAAKGKSPSTDQIVAGFVRPFDLTRELPMRMGLVEEEERYVLMVDIHHIVSDMLSMDVIVKDLTALYSGMNRPGLRIQYKDYALWQNSEREKESIRKMEDFWLEEFSGEIPILDIITDFPRPMVQRFEGDSIMFEIGSEETAALNRLTAENNATMFMMVLAVFNILLAKVGGKEDIVIGSPVAGRRHADLEPLIGLFINTLSLRNRPRGEYRFDEFLQQVRGHSLAAFENQEYQFEDLVEKVQVSRDISRNPLFDVLFVWDHLSVSDARLPGLTPEPFRRKQETAKFDMTLYGWDTEERLIFRFEYCTFLFKEDTIRRFIKYFQKIISLIAANPQIRIGEMDIISEEEKEQLVFEFNDSAVSFPEDKTIHGIFEEQVERGPDRRALFGKRPGTGESVPVSYKELNEEAGRLALLLKSKGVVPGTIVAVIVDRSLEMVSGILAILKAGGAYLPLLPEYPEERKQYILKDSGAKIVLTTRDVYEEPTIPGVDTIYLASGGPPFCKKVGPKTFDEGQEPTPIGDAYMHPETGVEARHAGPDDLAYIIYTSGSTGQPKGTAVEHGSVVNLLYGLWASYPFLESDVYLVKTPYVFDVSVSELFGWYMGGGSLLLLEKDGEKDPEKIFNAISSGNVTHVNFVPSMFGAFLDFMELKNIDRLGSLKYIFLAGEALPPEMVERFKARNTGVQLENIYGPTEATVYASRYSLQDWDSAADLLRVPIGKPVSNAAFYVLDIENRLQPIGVPGELYIAGKGVARGYLNRPELTDEKFAFGDQGAFLKNRPPNKEDAVRLSQFPYLLRGKFPQKTFDNKKLCSNFFDPAARGADKGFGLEVPSSGGVPEGRGGLAQTSNFQLPTYQLIYKTGDLCRWLPDGNIDFLGRMDHQVKIRGFRIELGEVETHLQKLEPIKTAVVVSKKGNNGSNYLAAYFTPEEGGTGEDARIDLNASYLRDYLSARIPHYMIPSYFVKLDSFPLTPSGKIDRTALPDPMAEGLDSGSEYAAPVSPLEKKLAETWERVLGRENIGVNDDFFAVGGDSIKAIQIAARMNQAGYKMQIYDLFLYPSIARLAPVVKKAIRRADQSIVTGRVPLTPIQKWFFANDATDIHYYNHAVMLFSKEVLEIEGVETVFRKIQEHHDGLRSTFNEEAGEIIQTVRGVEYPLFVKEYDFRGREDATEALERTANEIQASIDLKAGPSMKTALFHMDDGDRLLVVIHHLVIDGVSWRILFEDIDTLYRRYKKGESFVLPLKSDSFKLWSEKLVSFAGSDRLLKSKPYWAQLEAEVIAPIRRDFAEENCYIDDTGNIPIVLSEEETQKLLTRVHHAFGTEINDILLTALGLAVKNTWGTDRVLIAMESHGREDVMPDIDINRTIGWFTAIYPVVLDMSYDNDLFRQVIEVKESLRRVPDRGVTYGILKYLTPAAHIEDMTFRLAPQIGFNYLGQVDADVEHTSFRGAAESAGKKISVSRKQDYELQVSGITANSRLGLSVSFSKKQYKEETLQTFLTNYKKALIDIISFCSTREERTFTPADFTYKGLSLRQVEELTHRYAVEDIYPLSPMQAGIMFHSLNEEDTSTYMIQIDSHIRGVTLDTGLVERSLNTLFERHEVLRTAFVHEELDHPLQVVLGNRKVDFYYEDIRQMSSDEEKRAFITDYKKRDRNRAFILSKDALMRTAFIRTHDDVYAFIWSFHHILLDGWCIAIIASEFFAIYSNLLRNRDYRLPPAKPYRTYIEWLGKQDENVSKHYWIEYLAGYDEKIEIPKAGEAPGSATAGEDRQGIREAAFVLSSEDTARLNRMVDRLHVTLNTLVQTAWAIQVGSYGPNAVKDVVFGAVVSGRPAEIEGVESMVGLFINTIPVRYRYKKNTPLKELLRTAQQKALESDPYHYYPLARIQADSALKRDLIDHILAFENFPSQIRQEDDTNGSREERTAPAAAVLTFSESDAFVSTNYDLEVVVVPGETLRIKLRYKSFAYEGPLIEKAGLHFKELLQKLPDHEDDCIKDLKLSGGEKKKKKILNQFLEDL